MTPPLLPAAALEVKGLRYRYPDGTAALNGMSFAVAAGECVGVIGPNGNCWISRVTPIMKLWMLVDSSGSTKPEARPSAMQFFSHTVLRAPAR